MIMGIFDLKKKAPARWVKTRIPLFLRGIKAQLEIGLEPDNVLDILAAFRPLFHDSR